MRLTIDPTSFQQATKALERTVRRNALMYGRSLGRQFESYAKQGAPWTDRRGVARAGVTSSARATGTRVTVTMGASAPNYKRHGPLSSPDYMEYLEFDHGGEFAVVYPTVDSMMQGVRETFGPAVLKGTYGVRIRRDRAAARRRERKARARRK